MLLLPVDCWFCTAWFRLATCWLVFHSCEPVTASELVADSSPSCKLVSFTFGALAEPPNVTWLCAALSYDTAFATEPLIVPTVVCRLAMSDVFCVTRPSMLVIAAPTPFTVVPPTLYVGIEIVPSSLTVEPPPKASAVLLAFACNCAPFTASLLDALTAPAATPVTTRLPAVPAILTRRPSVAAPTRMSREV